MSDELHAALRNIENWLEKGLGIPADDVEGWDRVKSAALAAQPAPTEKCPNHSDIPLAECPCGGYTPPAPTEDATLDASDEEAENIAARLWKVINDHDCTVDASHVRAALATPPAPTALRCSVCGVAVTHEHGGLKHGLTPPAPTEDATLDVERLAEATAAVVGWDGPMDYHREWAAARYSRTRTHGVHSHDGETSDPCPEYVVGQCIIGATPPAPPITEDRQTED